jgi:hypothetical protein
MDEQFQRIDAILGDSRKRGFPAAVKVFFEHLRRSLVLPCEVTGIEDFQWEEFYVIGPGSRKEYERLKKHQPSYRDRFELMEIEMDVYSEWMPVCGRGYCRSRAAQVRPKGIYVGFGRVEGG